MIIGGSNWRAYGPDGASRSEKVRPRKSLTPVLSAPKQSKGRASGARADETLSRFGTEGSGETILLPASAFAAQLIGQVLRTNRADQRIAANAYARTAEEACEPLVLRSLKA